MKFKNSIYPPSNDLFQRLQRRAMVCFATLILALQLGAQPSVYYGTPTTPSLKNAAFGYLAINGLATVTGDQNTAAGCQALLGTTTGLSNTGIGYRSLHGNTSGSHNTAVGDFSMVLNLTGKQNVAIGSSALQYNTSGNYNTAVGMQALRYCPSGSQQVAVGYQALYSNLTGLYNHGTGFQSLYSNTSGSRNTGSGFRTLSSNSSGVNNTATGFEAISSNTIGSNNTADGYQALLNNTIGEANSAFGGQALAFNTTGHHNTALGQGTMYANTTGTWNTAAGNYALGSNTTGYRNAALGTGALSANTTGVDNSAFGIGALTQNVSGYGNSGLGYNAYLGGPDLHNSTVIGYNAVVNANNKIRFGDAAVTVVEGPVNYTISDGRFKSNVTAGDVKGLEFIQKLRPVVYNFDAEKFDAFLTHNMPDSAKAQRSKSDFAAATAIRQSGFIAQEVELAAKEIGYDFNGVHVPENENDNYSLAYSQFVVPLVRAVQEQQQMIEDLRKEILEMRGQGESRELGLQWPSGSSSNGLQIAPNPSNGKFSVKVEGFSAGLLTVDDLSGHRLFETSLVDNQKSYQIDLSTVARGLYIVSVRSSNGIVASQKLVLE